MASFPSSKRVKLEPSTSTWQPVIDASLDLPARRVPVAAKVSSWYAKWSEGHGNKLFFNVGLLTSTATQQDISEYPAHAAAIDLASHSEFFDRKFSYQVSNTLSSGSEDLSNIVLALDVPQKHLHTVIAALYKGSIDLNPSNVESILMVAQYLSIRPVMMACQEYLLQDMVKNHASTTETDTEPQATAPNADAAVQAAQVICCYADWMMPELLRATPQLPWASPRLHQLLNKVLTLADASTVLQQKKEDGYVCETQVLDCIKNIPSKRTALLQQLVSFNAMHKLELEAVIRYAAVMTKPSASEDIKPSLASTSSDGFWPAVLSSAASTRLDGPLQTLPGLQLFSWDTNKLSTAAATRQVLTSPSWALDNTNYYLRFTPGLADTPNEHKLGLFLHPTQAGTSLCRDNSTVSFTFLALAQQPSDAGADGAGETGAMVRVADRMEPPQDLKAGTGWGLPGVASTWAGIAEMRFRRGVLEMVSMGVAARHQQLASA